MKAIIATIPTYASDNVTVEPIITCCVNEQLISEYKQQGKDFALFLRRYVPSGFVEALRETLNHKKALAERRTKRNQRKGK